MVLGFLFDLIGEPFIKKKKYLFIGTLILLLSKRNFINKPFTVEYCSQFELKVVLNLRFGLWPIKTVES